MDPFKITFLVFYWVHRLPVFVRLHLYSAAILKIENDGIGKDRMHDQLYIIEILQSNSILSYPILHLVANQILV